MKKTIFTVIVAVLAAAFFMVGNSFAEDQEQNAQEQIIETEADCTISGTGFIFGTITRSCDGSLVPDVRVDSSMGTGTYTNNGVYFLMSPSGSGLLYFRKANYPTEIYSYRMCAGETIEINKVVTWSCKTTTTTMCRRV